MNDIARNIVEAAAALDYTLTDYSHDDKDGSTEVVLENPQGSTIEICVSQEGIVESSYGTTVDTGDGGELEEDGRDLSTTEAVVEFLEEYKEW